MFRAMRRCGPVYAGGSMCLPPNNGFQATLLRCRSDGNFRHAVLSDRIVVLAAGGAPELKRSADASLRFTSLASAAPLGG